MDPSRPAGDGPRGWDDLDEDAEHALELERRRQFLADRPDVEAARSAVLRARANLVEETTKLEASARAAVDIPSKIRREPGRTAGVAAGAAFLLLGGPKRVFQGVRRAVLGRRADLPKSMLPDEIDKELRKLGDDGQRVRAKLEREFVHYLDERSELRRDRDLVGTLSAIAGNLLKPASIQAGKRLAERLLDSDAASFNDALARARARAEQRARRKEERPGGASTR
jgi:hypothetical protein